MASSLFCGEMGRRTLERREKEDGMERNGTDGHEENPGKTQKTLAICGENGYN